MIRRRRSTFIIPRTPSQCNSISSMSGFKFLFGLLVSAKEDSSVALHIFILHCAFVINDPTIKCRETVRASWVKRFFTVYTAEAEYFDQFHPIVLA